MRGVVNSIYMPSKKYTLTLFQRRLKEGARSKVQYALKSGKLKKQPCEVCSEYEAEAHHPDYSLPLTVLWLCKRHHEALERLLSKQISILPNGLYTVGQSVLCLELLKLWHMKFDLIAQQLKSTLAPYRLKLVKSNAKSYCHSAHRNSW